MGPQMSIRTVWSNQAHFSKIGTFIDVDTREKEWYRRISVYERLLLRQIVLRPFNKGKKFVVRNRYLSRQGPVT